MYKLKYSVSKFISDYCRCPHCILLCGRVFGWISFDPHCNTVAPFECRSYFKMWAIMIVQSVLHWWLRTESNLIR